MSGKLMVTRNQSVALVSILLVVLILSLYWPVQNYEFNNYDDNVYVTDNDLTRQGISFQSVKDAFTDISTGNWHPLAMISLMLDWQLFKNKSGGYHWTSVIIHIFNAVLLFLFLHIVTGTLWRSAFVAALFAVHPLNVESVAWIAERKNVLSIFFWMTTMLLYAWYVKSPGWKRYLPVIFSFALALMSKAIIVTLPFALLLLDYWPLKRTKIRQQDEEQNAPPPVAARKEKISFLFLEKTPLLALSAVDSVLTLYAADSVKTIATLEKIPVMQRAANVIISYALYIKKMFWPFDLTVLYPFNHNIPCGHVILAALLIAAITFFVCVYFRRFPFLSVGWFWYLGTMIPVIGIIQVGLQSMADRWAYVSFIGLFVMLAWGVSGIFNKSWAIKLVSVVSAAAIVALIVASHYQLKTWENSYTLWRRALDVADENFVSHKNMANYFISKEMPREALHHLQKARELWAEDDGIYNHFGVAYWMLGRDSEAVEQYKIALKINPSNALSHSNMGVVLLRMGKVDEAEKHLREAVRLGIKYPQAHFYLAEILRQKGFSEEAEEHYQKAYRLLDKIIVAK